MNGFHACQQYSLFFLLLIGQDRQLVYAARVTRKVATVCVYFECVSVASCLPKLLMKLLDIWHRKGFGNCTCVVLTGSRGVTAGYHT